MSTATTPLGAIREHCIHCAGESWREVEKCLVTKCPLYEWRFGKHAYREIKPLTEAQRENLRRLHETQEEGRGRGARISPNEDSKAIRGVKS